MVQTEKTYTVAATDPTGAKPIVYLKPNYFEPSAALEALLELREQNPLGIFKVFEYSGRLLDDQELQTLVDEQRKRA